jgi:hypothetical protein
MKIGMTDESKYLSIGTAPIVKIWMSSASLKPPVCCGVCDTVLKTFEVAVSP